MSFPGDHTPNRSSHSQRNPARSGALANVLRELHIRPPGEPVFRLVSRWAAKHVWRVDVNGEPWAFIRYLLGPAPQFPDRWRHLALGDLLFEAKVGPRILGMTEASEALGGRATVVEAALHPMTRYELEARVPEAIGLFARLHGNAALHEALSENLTEADRRGFSPLVRYFQEIRERWFEAVVPRWLEVGLDEINLARSIVAELMNELERLERGTGYIGIIVPCHNDPNHGNFMVNRQGALRMIDFEELALSNPVADLGVFLTWYADAEQHRSLLEHYPLANPNAVLDRMRIWVPLRYINIAAHWSARLTRARDQEAWDFAVHSVDEWLRGACELVYGGAIPSRHERALQRLHHALTERGPLPDDASEAESD